MQWRRRWPREPVQKAVRPKSCSWLAAPRMRDLGPAFRVARDSFKCAAEKRAGTSRWHRLQRATARPHFGFQTGAFDATEARSRPRLPAPPESARCLPKIRSPSDSVQRHPASSPLTRSPAGQQVEAWEARTEAKCPVHNVGTLIQLRLRSSKSRRSRHRIHAPVHHVNFAKLPDHHVLRLEISMNDAPGMCKRDRLSDPADQPKPLSQV